MIEIKVGILLDACDISCTRKQLSKLEDLINNFVQIQISKYLKEIDTDPIAINKDEDALDDKLETKNEIKTEETDFSEDIDTNEKNIFVSEDLISDYIPKDSVTEIKVEVEENESEPMHDLSSKDEINNYNVNEDNQLVCTVCKLSCESKILLDLHFKMTHTAIHICEICQKSVQNEKDCHICKESFDSKEKFHEHMQTLHLENYCHDCFQLSFDQRYNFKWTCPCCSEKFYVGDIYRHFKDCETIFHKENAGCLECDKKFDYKTHKKECQVCKDLFESKEKFKEHMEILHKETFCPFCSKYFSPEDLANHHTAIHICDICQKSVNYKSQHMKESHNEKDCHICKESFDSKEKFKEHMQDLHKENYCHDCFQFSSFTSEDMAYHNRHKHFCKICQKRVQSKSKHMVAEHSDLRCDDCGKCYVSSKKLNLHKNTMHGPKSFECENCSKSFAAQSDLNYHMKRSHGVKDEKCPKCKK